MSENAGTGPQEPGAGRLRDIVMELERHSAEQGWDQPIRLYALVPTSDLVQREPQLAKVLGVEEPVAEDALTPVEQEPLTSGLPLEEILGRIAWPDPVVGCALVMERLVVKGSDETHDIPEGVDPAEWAREQPGSEEIRLVAAVLRGGEHYCAMRMRRYDTPDQVLSDEDLVPGLTSALALTFEDVEDTSGPAADPTG